MSGSGITSKKFNVSLGQSPVVVTNQLIDKASTANRIAVNIHQLARSELTQHNKACAATANTVNFGRLGTPNNGADFLTFSIDICSSNFM